MGVPFLCFQKGGGGGTKGGSEGGKEGGRMREQKEEGKRGREEEKGRKRGREGEARGRQGAGRDGWTTCTVVLTGAIPVFMTNLPENCAT